MPTLMSQPTIQEVRRVILNHKKIWFKLPRDQQKEIMKCWRSCENPWLSPEYVVEKISPGWTLVLEPAAMVRFEDKNRYSREEQELPAEDFLRIMLIRLWWEQIKKHRLTPICSKRKAGNSTAADASAAPLTQTM